MFFTWLQLILAFLCIRDLLTSLKEVTSPYQPDTRRLMLPGESRLVSYLMGGRSITTASYQLLMSVKLILTTTFVQQSTFKEKLKGKLN